MYKEDFTWVLACVSHGCGKGLREEVIPTGGYKIFPIKIFQRDENFPAGRIFSSRIFLEKREYFKQKYFSPLEIFLSNGGLR